MVSSATVSWQEMNLQDLAPDLAYLKTTLSALDVFYTAMGAVSQANAAFNALYGPLLQKIDPALTAAQAVASTLRNQLNDIREAGMHLLLIPPRRGGYVEFGNNIRLHLLDTSDPRRPLLSSSSNIGAAGCFAYASNNIAADLLLTSLTDFVLFKEDLKKASGFDKVSATALETLQSGRDKLAVVDMYWSHLKQQLRGTAQRPPVEFKESVWLSATLADFIPGVNELFSRVDTLISSMTSMIPTTSQITKYLQFIGNQVSTFSALVSDVKDLIDYGLSLFTSLPLRVFGIPTFLGGTDELAQFIPTAFSTTQSVLADVPDNSWCTGIIFVWGGLTSADASGVELIFKTLLPAWPF